jgi:hypothetical protein
VEYDSPFLPGQGTDVSESGVQKVMTALRFRLLDGTRQNFDQSFNQSLSIVSGGAWQFLNPVLEHALELLKSDAVKQLCQSLGITSASADLRF